MDLLNGLTWQNKELVIQYPVAEITASKFKKCQSVKDQEQKLDDRDLNQVAKVPAVLDKYVYPEPRLFFLQSGFYTSARVTMKHK